jgi:four helix bundle protein
MKSSILKQKTFEFSVKIVRLVQRLQTEKKEFVMSQQLLKCGTSPGANYSEAEFAQSKDDFISKLSIALKETNETSFFLALLNATGYIEHSVFKDLEKDCGEIKAMLISSVRTTKSSINKQVY